ncbi:recombinase family protein [Rhodococcoides fascians]|uniref:recombinase family protein n=1 Tax=Rhodococcoides fascians TaxID=1828 RepID=UPI0009B871D5|nr:recombinase family protein [Rhodococcus fascians]
MKAAIYCRISKARRTDEDDADTLGVDRQESLCRKLAAAQGYDVVDVFVDNDLSGKAGVLRPQFEALKSAVADKSIDVVMVWKTDRLSRDRIALQLFYELLRKHGVRLHTEQEGVITLDTPDGQLMAGIRAELAQYERGVISERVKAQKTQAAQSGRVLGGRYRLYGYEDKHRTKIDAAEAKVIKKMSKDYLAGKSLHSIARSLNENEVPSLTGVKWTTQQVKRILRNPAYAGLRVFNDEVVADGQWPKILDLSTHQALVEKLTSYPAQNRDHNRKYLLSGILYCTLCNTRMVGGKTAFPSYRCTVNQGGCGRLSRNAAKVDAFVLELTAKAIARLPKVEPERDTSELDSINADIDSLSNARAEQIIPMAEYIKQYQILKKKKESLVKAAATTKLPTTDPQKFLDMDDIDVQREIIRKFFPAIGVKKSRKGVRFSHDQLKFD